MMKRREFIALLGGAAAGWSVPAQAQPGERKRRIGVLLPANPTDSEYPVLVNAFRQGLQQLGWREEQNLRIEIRWSGANADAIRKNAVDLVALTPDAILASGSASAGPLLQVTRTIPVVFTVVPDPVGAGFVETLAQPAGNATGFSSFEYGLGGKWLEVLKEIAPAVTHVGVLRDPASTAGIGQWSAIQTAAPTVGVEVSPINQRASDDLESAVAAFARSGNGGLVVTSSAPAIRDRDLIVLLAAKYKLPAIYYAGAFVTAGGLIAYGPDRTDQFRRAAGYVDRILKGEKPADLPVQAPVKYEIAINLKAAKTLGLEVPPSLLARADEVIE
jgi:putative tryptophan/tyrosine transport system substrate-binding protein